MYNIAGAAAITLIALMVTTSEVSHTSIVGGGGGQDFRYVCEENGYLVGLVAGVGAWIDSVQAVCAYYDPKTGKMSGHHPEGPIFGGAGQPNRVQGVPWKGSTGGCLVNDVVYAFGAQETKNQPVLGHIVLACFDSVSKRRPSSTPEDQPARVHLAGTDEFKYGSNGTPGDQCPPGAAAVGFRGRAGIYIDAFGLVCATFGWPHVPKMTSRQNGAGEMTFFDPSERAASGEIVRLDNCTLPGNKCGLPAAETFCQAQQFKHAVIFELTEAGQRTYIPYAKDGQKICDGSPCVALKSVRCSQTGMKVLPVLPAQAPPPKKSGTIVGNGWNFTNYLAADFTGDGKADLLVRTANGDALLYPFDGTTFVGAGGPITAGNAWNFTDFWAADWTDDKRADILARAANGNVYLYAMQANNTTYGGGPKQQALGWSFNLYLPADFNGDGITDMIGLNPRGDLLLLGLGGQLIPSKVGSGFVYTHLVTADFTGDGKADVVGRAQNGDMFLAAFNGSSFDPPTKVGTGWNFTNHWAGDWTGDGKADLLVRTATGELLLYPIKDNSFLEGGGPIKAGNGWNFTHYFAADFSGDGKLDMVVRTASGDLLFYPWLGERF